MSDYQGEFIQAIEKKWQRIWEDTKLYETKNDFSKPKHYVLDMFPYPSGAGLHVGHPLGYIASDIYARFKRLNGFNVLHPMGFDAFGLPAEQYALDHGIHPAVSTAKNIDTFKRQLKQLGFSYDWSREVQTCDPNYYRWTQWIFIQLFESWYNRTKKKAEKISALISIFDKEGNAQHPFPNTSYSIQQKKIFSANDWKNFSEQEKQEVLMQYRLAYLAYTDVNWCEALGTVLANDEVINGVSYRGGHPVVKKKMRQWSLRITEYADRLLEGLEEIDFSDSMKEIQRNWIGKSVGAFISFPFTNTPKELTVFTTRPETIFGVDFMVMAPEHEWVPLITSPEQKKEVDEYIRYVQSRSEVERIAEVKKVTGCFTGSYVLHPFTKKQIPVWISEYVLAGYGTGAIMAVPCGDERDFKFAKHFQLSITNIIGKDFNGEDANPTWDAVLENSDFLNGLTMRQAFEKIIVQIEQAGIGKKQIQYKMRDAGWSRQRYWGEPFPVFYENDMPQALTEKELPLRLPDIQDFKPSGSGEGPLANVPNWVVNTSGKKQDTNTMPTHAGAAWYFLRYMDTHNDKEFADRKALDYWNQVDVYVGGSEHAVAHLLYARLWVKVLYDLGYLSFQEPFKKLINQGKITGDSRLVYRRRSDGKFISHGLKDKYETDELRVDVSLVNGVELNLDELKKWKPEFSNAEFELEEGKYICGTAVEKMSKSYYNVVNPDDVVKQYGADTLRLYEMFLGPIEQSKPWNTHGMDGVFKFLRRVWNLIHTAEKISVSDEEPTPDEMKALHKAIKKVNHQIEHFSFNTCVSEMMICVNELSSLKCNKRKIVEPLLIMLAPFAPHITEELWQQLGHTASIHLAQFPTHDEKWLKEDAHEYPISINGKVRTKIIFSLSLTPAEIETQVRQSDIVKKWTEQGIKKIIVVPGKIVNVVV